MLDVGFRELRDSAIDLRDKQSIRYPFYITASVPVASRATERATFVCDEDGDLDIMGLNGTIVAPADINGRRQFVDPVNFWPFTPGGTDYYYSGYECDGLLMRIFSNSGKEYQLTDPQQLFPAKHLLNPGYAVGKFSRPYPFKHYLKRGEKLTFEFYNNTSLFHDGGAPLYQYVTLTLQCRKIAPFTV